MASSTAQPRFEAATALKEDRCLNSQIMAQHFPPKCNSGVVKSSRINLLKNVTILAVVLPIYFKFFSCGL